jgi:hypothetical protein
MSLMRARQLGRARCARHVTSIVELLRHRLAPYCLLRLPPIREEQTQPQNSKHPHAFFGQRAEGRVKLKIYICHEPTNIPYAQDSTTAQDKRQQTTSQIV